MKLLACILNRIALVRADRLPDGTCCTEAYLLRRGVLSQAGPADIKGLPVLVLVFGSGVVTKPDGAQIVARIRADEKTFVWNSCGGNTSFMRREHLSGVRAELATRSIVPVRLFCADERSDLEVVAIACARQFSESLHWKQLINISEESSAVVQALVRRAALPVLGVFLSLLAANTLLSSRLDLRRGLLQAEFAARERAESESASSDAGLRKLLEAFGGRPVPCRSIVCDRIARAVPEKVKLAALEIEPLIKRFEAGKPLQRREGMAAVRGNAPTAAEISLFVQRLTESAYCREVRLVSVEKSREANDLVFRIELKL